MELEPFDDLTGWLIAARGGSAEALGQALEACRAYLLLVANRELEPELQAKAGASDLVQETFLNAQRNFHQFQGASPEELRGWLRAILLNNLGNLRRRYRDTDKRQLARELSLESDDSQDDLKKNLAANTPSPSDHAVRHEQTAAVEQALARLPEDHRQVIVWRHQENCSFEEIGQRLGRSVDAARMLWWRAIERLQDELGETPK
jgi:RNA polymerase sigma-70 factor (ECF subfamily)